jgi:hypothetical protein
VKSRRSAFVHSQAALTAADAMYSKLVTCVPKSETARTLW